MKRKLMFLALVAIVVVLGYFYLRPPLPVLGIDNVYNVTEEGSTVIVNATLKDVSTCSGWQMNLTWDPYYLKPTTVLNPVTNQTEPAITEGPFLQSLNATPVLVFNEVDLTRGVMIVADIILTQGKYVSGSGVILVMNFTVMRVGRSAIEIHSPTPNDTKAIVADLNNQKLEHVEVNGLVTNEGPPPIWASTDFQTTLIYGEIAVLGVASGILYIRAHPRPPKALKRKAELQPMIDPEDQVESK